MARISRSGGIEPRPIGEYSLPKSADSDLSAALATAESLAADDCANPFLKVYVAEKADANPVVSTHRSPLSPNQGITMRKFGNPFSASC
jgi:hypothetical protein